MQHVNQKLLRTACMLFTQNILCFRPFSPHYLLNRNYTSVQMWTVNSAANCKECWGSFIPTMPRRQCSEDDTYSRRWAQTITKRMRCLWSDRIPLRKKIMQTSLTLHKIIWDAFSLETCRILCGQLQRRLKNSIWRNSWIGKAAFLQGKPSIKFWFHICIASLPRHYVNQRSDWKNTPLLVSVLISILLSTGLCHSSSVCLPAQNHCVTHIQIRSGKLQLLRLDSLPIITYHQASCLLRCFSLCCINICSSNCHLMPLHNILQYIKQIETHTEKWPCLIKYGDLELYPQLKQI